MGIAELTRNAVDVLPEGALEAKLKLGRPLRIKLGVDPTSPDLHLGFAFALENLRSFQEEGHEIVLIVGDYTARIGDPSGRSAERPGPRRRGARRERARVRAARRTGSSTRSARPSASTASGSASSPTRRRCSLCRTMTVARLLERDDFAKRFAAHAPISLSELLYPLMQAYDSVAIEADIEIGRHRPALQPARRPRRDDAVRARAADRDHVPAADRPRRRGEDVEVEGELHRDPGSARGDVRQGDVDPGQAPRPVVGDHARPAGRPRTTPMESKLALARGIVEKWHGPRGRGRGRGALHARRPPARGARGRRRRRRSPTAIRCTCRALLVELLGVGSTSEARRLIAQGGVKLDGEAVRELDVPRARLEGATLQAGKRRFLRFRSA